MFICCSFVEFDTDSEEDDDPMKAREKSLEQWHSQQLAVRNNTGSRLHYFQIP